MSSITALCSKVGARLGFGQLPFAGLAFSVGAFDLWHRALGFCGFGFRVLALLLRTLGFRAWGWLSPCFGGGGAGFQGLEKAKCDGAPSIVSW